MPGGQTPPTQGEINTLTVEINHVTLPIQENANFRIKREKWMNMKPRLKQKKTPISYIVNKTSPNQK